MPFSLKKLFNNIYLWLNRRKSPSYYWGLREKVLASKGLRRFYNVYLMDRIHERFNCDIPLSAEFANRPAVPHGLNGIFVSKGARIGCGCVILHQVTIGSNPIAGSAVGAPVIGDEVFIGVGAKIIGGVKVGNNVRIGANCVVVKDVPDNSTVVPAAARVIERGVKRDNGYVPYEGLE
jgi:serine O-acetyltransferase